MQEEKESTPALQGTVQSRKRAGLGSGTDLALLDADDRRLLQPDDRVDVARLVLERALVDRNPVPRLDRSERCGVPTADRVECRLGCFSRSLMVPNSLACPSEWSTGSKGKLLFPHERAAADGPLANRPCRVFGSLDPGFPIRSRAFRMACESRAKASNLVCTSIYRPDHGLGYWVKAAANPR